MVSCEKKETVVKLQKFASNMESALRTSFSENSWDNFPLTNAQTPEFIKTSLLPYINILKVCPYNKGGCFPKSVGYLSGGENLWYWARDSFILNDGTLIMLELGGANILYGQVDINGFKGPNKFGRDVFRFDIKNNKNKLFAYSPGGGDREYSLRRCSHSSVGDSCGFLIQLDGWQIKEDYPW